MAFDFAIAQSVFTHVPLDHIRLCLYQLSLVMAPGGAFLRDLLRGAGEHPL